MLDATQPPPKHKLRWFQYRLRSLFILMFLVAVACSWLTVKMVQARKQKKAVDVLREMGGIIEYDYQRKNTEMYAPAWLRKILGDDFFNNVTHVWLKGWTGRKLTDNDLDYHYD
jgi:hypothetical protein